MDNATGFKSLVGRIFCASLVGAGIGVSLAQAQAVGWLDTDCAGRCTAAGYDGEFCQSMCWVPDPVEAAEGDRLDWKCFETCAQRGGKARACVASCRR